MPDDPQELPQPGGDPAPHSNTQGVDEDVKPDEASDTVTKHEQSSLGPGAGESEVVKVTSPVQHEGDPVTSHPSLRGDDSGPKRD